MSAQTWRRPFLRASALRIAATVGLLTVALALVVAPTPARADDAAVAAFIDSFVSCTQTEGSAAVLLLVDQSASLRGENGSDPEKVRKPAGAAFVEQLANLAATDGNTVAVQTAGFSNDFVAGQWYDLDTQKDQALAAQQAVSDRDDGAGTDYWNALEGARGQLAGHPGKCKMVVWFTDGDYDLDGASAEPAKSYSTSNVTDDFQAVENDGLASICSKDSGPVDSIRYNNWYLAAFGLSKDNAVDTTILQKTVMGTDCGDAPAANHAVFIPVTDAERLPWAFASAFAGSTDEKPYDKGVATIDFGLDSYITTVSAIADPGADLTGVKIGLRGPADKEPNWVDGDAETFTMSGMDIAATRIANRTVRFDMKAQGGSKAFVGTWAIVFEADDPNNAALKGAAAQAGFTLVTDLKPKWVDPLKSAEVGETIKMKVQVVHSDGAPVTPAPPKSNVKVSFVDAKGVATQLAAGTAAQFEAGVDVAFKPPAGAGQPAEFSPAVGSLAIELALVTEAPPSKAIRPETVSSPFAIKAPVNYPTVTAEPLPLAFSAGEVVQGVEPASARFTVSGPGCVWLDGAESSKDVSLPNGTTAVVFQAAADKEENCLKLEEGKSADFEVTLAPDQQGNGSVSGQLQVVTVPADAASGPPIVVPIDFTAERSKQPNVVFGGLAFVVALVLGLGIPAALLFATRARSAKITVAHQFEGELQYALKQVTVTESGVSDAIAGGQVSIGRDDIRPVLGEGDVVSSLEVEGVLLRARAFGNPFSVPDIRVSREGLRLISDVSTTPAKDGSARIPLTPQNHWVAWSTGPETAAVLVFFSSNNTSDQDLAEVSDRFRDGVEGSAGPLVDLCRQTDPHSGEQGQGSSQPEDEWVGAEVGAGSGGGDWTGDPVGEPWGGAASTAESAPGAGAEGPDWSFGRDDDPAGDGGPSGGSVGWGWDSDDRRT